MPQSGVGHTWHAGDVDGSASHVCMEFGVTRRLVDFNSEILIVFTLVLPLLDLSLWGWYHISHPRGTIYERC